MINATETRTETFPDAEPIQCQSIKEWLAERRTVVGASDSAGILGCGYSNQSLVGIFTDKAFGAKEVDEQDAPLKFRIGKRKEPLLRELFSEEANLPCFAPAAAMYRSRLHSFIGCSLDGETIHPEHGLCPVELKNVGRHALADWESENPPLKFNVQLQHQLLVTGAQVGFLVGLVADEELFIREIKRDNEFLAVLVDALKEFWGYVERRELPPLDASEATSRALSLAYPRDSGNTIVLPPASAAWVDDIESAKASIKTAEAIKTAAENQLKAALGENTAGILPDGRQVTWKSQSRAEHVVKASEFRVLRITKGR